LSSWFSAARTNVVAPIGVGETPINGDTAQFYFAGTNVGTVLQYNGTAWTNVTGQVIDGNLIVGGTIAANQIAANAITAGKIQASAVTTDKLDANSITAVKIQADAVTADKILANAVTAIKINASAVTADKIAANAVTAAKIDTDAVTAAKIQAGAVVAGKIAADAVSATNIQADAVTAVKIQANAVTSDKILANAVVAGKIAASAVTTNTIAAAAITTDKLAANLIISQDIQSTGATVGNFSSPGYWLQGSTGNARFGGTVSIGNNLTVGNLITASALNANVVSYTNIVPGVIPNAGDIVFNAGSVSMTTSAGTWDGIYSGSVYYKQLAYQRITANPGWTTLGPTLRITASALITGTGYTSSGGYPQLFIYINSPGYGGNNIAPVTTGGSTPPPNGSYNVRTDSTIFSPYTNFNGTFGYSVSSVYTGTNYWTTSYPTTIGFVLMNTLNGTWTVSNIQLTVNYN
jgi:hypothetical protein